MNYHYPVRYCYLCGHALREHSIYCINCGAQAFSTLIEHRHAPFPVSPKTTFIIITLTYGISILSVLALLQYFILFFGITLTPIEYAGLIENPLFLLLTLITTVTFIILPLGLFLKDKIPLSNFGLTSGGGPILIKDILIGFAVGLALVPLLLGLTFYELLGPGFGPPLIPPSHLEIFWLGMNCLSIIIVVAPAEEFFFRGLVQNSLSAHYGKLPGILTATVIFGLLHLNPLIGVSHTVGGLFLGLVFQRQGGRLAAPITTHATYDCLILILDFFFI